MDIIRFCPWQLICWFYASDSTETYHTLISHKLFVFIYLYLYQGRCGGGGTPVHPQESEAGCNILNLHFYSDFFLFLSIDNVTICLFYMIIYKFITWELSLVEIWDCLSFGTGELSLVEILPLWYSETKS